MDKSTGSPSLAQLFWGRTFQELVDALAPFRKLRDEYRRRFKEDGIALTQDEAVEAYKLVAPLYAPDMTDEEAALYAVLEAIAFPCLETGEFVFREPAVKAFLEGFERMIAEGSDALYIRHLGETEARKVDPWTRFIAYEALGFFSAVLSACRITEGEMGSDFVRAQAILAKLTVTRPRGPHDPRLTLRRNGYIVAMLAKLGGCGLDVTSLEGDSLAGALAEAIDVPERTIRKVWEEDPSRSSQFIDALPAELRIPESLIRRPREYFAPGVQCAQCGVVGKVPKFRAHGSRLCLGCKPRDAW